MNPTPHSTAGKVVHSGIPVYDQLGRYLYSADAEECRRLVADRLALPSGNSKKVHSLQLCSQLSEDFPSQFEPRSGRDPGPGRNYVYRQQIDSPAGRFFLHQFRPITRLPRRLFTTVLESVSIESGLALARTLPMRSERYKQFVRGLPCTVCRRPAPSEAAHTTALGPRGMSQKANDHSCIPLCGVCHREGKMSYHRLSEKKFLTAHALDIGRVVVDLLSRYSRSLAGA